MFWHKTRPTGQLAVHAPVLPPTLAELTGAARQHRVNGDDDDHDVMARNSPLT
jgi:hypothetical protein